MLTMTAEELRDFCHRASKHWQALGYAGRESYVVLDGRQMPVEDVLFILRVLGVEGCGDEQG